MPPIEIQEVDRELYTLGLAARCFGHELPPELPVAGSKRSVKSSFWVVLEGVEKRFSLDDLLKRLKELGFMQVYDAAQVTFKAFVSMLKRFADLWENPPVKEDEEELYAF